MWPRWATRGEPGGHKASTLQPRALQCGHGGRPVENSRCIRDEVHFGRLASMWPRWATRGEPPADPRSGRPPRLILGHGGRPAENSDFESGDGRVARAASMWPRWAPRGEPWSAPPTPATPGCFNVATVGDPWRTLTRAADEYARQLLQ